MKISEAWLREWVNPPVDTATLAEQITMAGLEVDALEAVAGEFAGVVVGEIVDIKPHPDADKLRVCQVSSGAGDPVQVVCGAPNARAGLKAPFARVGAVLPGDFKIKKAKLRGVESRGMLCAQTELGAGDDDSGLWELAADAPVGEPLQDYLQLSDSVIDIDLTPNRGDCLSLRGVAREVGVINREPVSEPVVEPVEPTSDNTFPFSIAATDACPRYLGRVIEGVDITRPSPLWLQEKLRRAGLRPRDCVVDVTNYVLLELGQPMHAFDRDKLDTEIVVRLADAGEKITLLDGQEVALKDDTLLITDSTGPVAMAGIMGGERTAVSETTRNIFFESAFFAPLALAGRARRYGLHTDASHRYERGVDYELPRLAMERATRLLIDIAGGEAGPIVDSTAEAELPAARRVALRRERILSGLGFSIPDAEVEDILNRLGLETQANSAQSSDPSVSNNQGWTFSVPSHRFDIEIEEDLLEELARIYGYNNLPTEVAPMSLAMDWAPEGHTGLAALKSVLTARDYFEAITYSFVGEELNSLFDPDSQPVKLQNPLSTDLAVMRTSLWPGLVNALIHNVNRQQSRVRLFESGMRFIARGEQLEQEPVLAGAITGARLPESWAAKETPADFYDLKGDMEALLAATGRAGEFQFEKLESGGHPALHPGQCAAIVCDGKPVGIMGALHPRIQQSLDLAQPVFLFELRQSDLLVRKVPEFAEISKFPEVRRDIAVLVDKSVQVSALQSRVLKIGGDCLQELKVFDLYVGKGIDPQRKSVALGLTFQHPSRTLTESEINTSIESVVKSLKEEFDAELR